MCKSLLRAFRGMIEKINYKTKILRLYNLWPTRAVILDLRTFGELPSTPCPYGESLTRPA